MALTTIKYLSLDAFEKDLKRLAKRFQTLEEDLEVAKRNAIELFHLKGMDSRSVFAVPGFGSQEIQIFKLKKFACKSLKGRGAQSGIRVIYGYHASSGTVEFIEMYFKADQPNEDRDRIKAYLKTH
jgi:hypothetical protein